MTTNNLKHHVLELAYEDFIQNDKTLQGLKVGKYTVTEKIGEGAYGSVWKGIDNQSEQLVAIKLLDLEAVGKEKSTYLKKILKKLIKSEAQMMTICDSPHTIKCYDVYENESLKLMLMEYCKDGDLEHEVRESNFLPEHDAVIILKQILNGLAELHSNKIIHRDLKPSNILINDQVYKIADFGFSKQLSSNSFKDELRHTTLGTIYTMAPEILKGSKYGLQADIWSVGVILYFMLYGRPPYQENSYEKVLKEIQKRKIFQVKHRDSKFKLSDEARSFISQCLKVDSQQRLNWTNIVNHKLFQKYDLNESLSGSNRKAVLLNKSCMIELDSKEIAINQDSTEQGSPNKYNHIWSKEEATSSIDTKNLRGSTCSTDSGYEWSKTAHFECQLTEIILTEVIEQLERLPQDLLQQRQIIELLCLLSARCQLNMSYKAQDIKNIQKTHATEIIVKLIQKIQCKAQQKHNKHKVNLVSKKGELLQIIKDGLLSIVNCQAGPSRDAFFNGVETNNQRSDARSDFTKREQIQYTQKMIINVKDTLQKDKHIDSKTLSYLTNYKNICYITLQQVGKNYNLKDYIQKHFSIL